ncbi:MAG TPA: DUF4097 family beta strand repeat-containing protein, partial [Longimicrobium sp.]|nr:DUF4097 family beta strand repeat-containing protein [Longimicrobium sp.]
PRCCARGGSGLRPGWPPASTTLAEIDATLEQSRRALEHVQSVAGTVELAGLRTPGVIAVRAGGGPVRADRVAAQALRVESTVGEVSLSALSVPAVTATSGGGRIRVSGCAAVRTLQLRSTTENVEIAVPADASATFTLRTTVGRLEVSAPVQPVERTARRFSGRMGSGATHVDASSASGIVRLHSP